MMNLLRGRVRWLLIFWMFIMSAIAYLDRVNISIAGGAIARDFHLDNVHLGWVFSSFVLGYALFQAPGGRLADRFGPRRIVTLGVIWWGVFTALSASVPVMAGALWIMIGVRFALGMGEAVVYPASNRLVAKWIPSNERGIANGLIFTGVGAGAGVTPPLIRYILENYGWRWSFWFSAIIGLLAGLVWHFIARDIPEEHPWVDREERELIEAGLPQAPEQHDSHRTLPWAAIFRSRDLLAMTASYFAYAYAAYIFFTWFFIYLSTVRGLNLKASSYYAMLPFAAMAIGSLLGGYLSDRLTKRYGKRVGRCGIAIVGIGLAAVFIALGTQVASAELASVVLAGGAGALYLSQSSFWSVTADLAGSSAGSVSGVMNMGGQMGGVVTASLSPWIAGHFGWTASFLTAAALCALGSAAWVWVDPEKKFVVVGS
ncbi:MAG: MFS transporter [Bryobacteraceae bacterium]|jgi:ACS family glucarate transporter-like MFS transporter